MPPSSAAMAAAGLGYCQCRAPLSISAQWSVNRTVANGALQAAASPTTVTNSLSGACCAPAPWFSSSPALSPLPVCSTRHLERRSCRPLHFLPLPTSSSSCARCPTSLHASVPRGKFSLKHEGMTVRASASSSSVSSSSATTAMEDGKAVDLPEALLFDCDGVLVDTERDGHRVSFNAAFKGQGLGVEWNVDLYGELLKIGGGKERMTHYFNQVGWPIGSPEGAEARKAFVAGLHKTKTELFMAMVETGALPLRPGVARLIDEAMSNEVKVAVCSTSNEKAVTAIVREMLGPEKAAAIRIFAGDVVPRKKPDPAIYNLAASELNVDPARCVVVEDSHIGLQAAKSAGMKCVITKSGYTADEDFSRADAVFDCIGDNPDERFGLTDLAKL